MSHPLLADPIQSQTDEQLVELARSGNSTAFSRLYHRHVGRVGRILKRMLGSSSEEVDDAVQLVFLDAARGLATMPNPAGFEPWLVRITVRRAFKQLRSRKRMSWLVTTAVLPEVSRTRDNEEVIALYRVLERMPVELRVVWTLREMEGNSIDEIAELCEISRSTAKRRIASAQEFLLKGFHRA